MNNNNQLYILKNNDQIGIYSNLNRSLIEMINYIIHDINLFYKIVQKELNMSLFSELNSYTIKSENGERLVFRGSLYQPWCHICARR